MKTMPLGGAVGRVSYPGCGIVVGKSADGESIMCAYFLMGRSPLSRNRMFVEEGGGVQIVPYRPELMRDSSTLVYEPICAFDNRLILSNGSHTELIYNRLLSGGTFEDALRSTSFGADAPHFTPRISALIELSEADFSLQMAIVKAADPYGIGTLRQFFEYEHMQPGTGYYLHTYTCDATPLPSFEGEPEPVLLSGSIFDNVADIWENLNHENKVALWVRTIHLSTHKGMSRIINRNR